jgi:hypothetical protein
LTISCKVLHSMYAVVLVMQAYYGLAINWKPLQALVTALLDRGVLQASLYEIHAVHVGTPLQEHLRRPPVKQVRLTEACISEGRMLTASRLFG